MTQTQYHQANMFAAADLPLFSGTAQHASTSTFHPAEPLLPEIQDVMPFVAPAQPSIVVYRDTVTISGPYVVEVRGADGKVWTQHACIDSYQDAIEIAWSEQSSRSLPGRDAYPIVDRVPKGRA